MFGPPSKPARPQSIDKILRCSDPPTLRFGEVSHYYKDANVFRRGNYEMRYLRERSDGG